MKNFALAMVLGGIAITAHAGDQVGRVTDVQGSVTVGSAGALTRAASGAALFANSTVLVSSGSKATVVLNDGCVISLKSNQHLALNAKLTCAQQVAAVTQLMTPYRLAQASGAPIAGSTGAATAGGLTALAVGGAIVVSGALLLNEVSVSGN